MSPAYAMELPPGTRLEKYELRKVLGQGGCGISYLAFDCQLEREVVLKEHFPLGLCRRSPGAAEVEATDETSYARSLQAFCREARILAGMRHAGIVAVHEIFAACGTAFLVMDYAEGENLRSWLARHPDARRIRTVLTNLLDALEYTHGSGVIHRDIKPDNIIIQPDGTPVLIDFGSAMMGAPTHPLTQVGTPAYAAPEQFTATQSLDARADLYALGQSLLIATRDAGVKLPRRLARTLRQATRPAPQERYASATEWKQILAATPGKYWITVGIGISILGLSVLAWAYYPGQKPAIKLVNDANSPYHGLPEGAPLHPIQLVHFDNDTCDFIRFSKAELPPREEALVQTILNAQQEFDKNYEAADKRLKGDPNYAHKMNWFLYKAQTQLNNKVIQEIHNYLNQYYPEGDPYSSWTMLLIANIRELRVCLIRPLLQPEYEPKN